MASAESPAPLQAPAAGDASRILKSMDQTTLQALRTIYDSHAGPDGHWGSESIKKFFEVIQGHTPEDAPTRLLAQSTLDFNTFLVYMTSVKRSIIKPPKKEDLDYSWPLSSYFISSSHNTYLSGNQLSSDSTTEAYVNALRRGCRCVEIDIWDGDDSDSESDTSNSSVEDKKSGGGLTRGLSLRKKISGNGPKRQSTFNMLKNKLVGSSPKKEKLSPTSGTPYATGTEAAMAKLSLDQTNSSEKESGPVAQVAVVEPRVLHGYTLTKDISFREVCNAIKQSAFEATDLPLIVSLEVHCNAEQQAIMVSIMKDAWKEFLLPQPEGDAAELPSPHQLRRKILVKVKYAPQGATAVDDDSPDDDRAATPPPKKTRAKIIHELSSLGIYTRGITFKSFAQPEAAMPSHIFSLSEKKFLDRLETECATLFEHNKHYLLRTYPSGLRIGSSNLNPPIFWGAGAQIVALNWQQIDEGMMLNEGMFQGTEGYVLKPPGYRPDLESNKATNVVSRKTLSLAFTFYAAQRLPFPPEDKSARSFKPYVKVELHVDASDVEHGKTIKTDGHEREGDYKAKTKTHKGCDIDLKAQKLEFNNIPGLVEDLTFVRFTVRDDEFGRDDLAAWACVRLDRLGEGYRYIQLLDLDGNKSDGLILVYVEKKLS
ncbi:PLC-like phosphodiesterase [Stachybotrys elegans]|uniref:Phosphoinositide phospholipase C n=1 Tax=Stachybotrys elegans TaxID=80388 RepID=A0A8K0WWF3_9HYPO|nr:PLC-like phosphodiesterase [Stachybotrys elegans]